jgi:sulfur carrier protein ThiS
MRVEVELHGTLRRLHPASRGALQVEIPEGSDIAALVARIGAAGQVWIAEVNGEVARFEHALARGDRVGLHGMIEGG